MANIKQLLIEKERFAYLENNPSLAQFFASTLDYVISLEEQVNKLESRLDTVRGGRWMAMTSDGA